MPIRIRFKKLISVIRGLIRKRFLFFKNMSFKRLSKLFSRKRKKASCAYLMNEISSIV